MKKCTLCKEEKKIDQFNKNKSKKDGLNTVCRDCGRVRSKRYYKENPDKHKKNVEIRNKLVKSKLKDFVNDLKSCGCIVCDEQDVVCLDFHHTGDDKEYNIATMIKNQLSEEKILSETSKCVVLCSNCHRKLHAGKITLQNQQ